MKQWMWLLLLLPMVSSADIISPEPRAVSVTIYRASEEGNPDLSNPDVDAEGIALISEARELDFPAGESTIEFVGVAQTIVPQSTRLDSLPGVIVEANFDYKLINPGELISNSIGKSVRLVRTDEDTGKVTEQRAKLVSGPDGVLLDIDGKIEALDCSGAHEKLVFDSVPENLRSRPVLSAKVRVNKAGHYIVRLNYLAMGFDWSANYVARVNSDGHTLDLTGWVTLANKQATSFVNAPVQVIAGNVERDESTKAVELMNVEQEVQCWPIGSFYSQYEEISVTGLRKSVLTQMDRMRAASAPAAAASELEEMVVAKQRDLGDYKLYELPFKTDLSSQQVKQVMMTYKERVPFEKIYTFTVDVRWENDQDDETPSIPAQLMLRMQNKKDHGLGSALPAGRVVVMESSDGQSLASGMDTIKDVAVGLPVDVVVGSVSDVQVSPRVVHEYEKTMGDTDYDFVDMEVTLTNSLAGAVQFELRQDVESGNASITKESKRHIMRKGLPTWVVGIPPRSQRVIKYTLRLPD